MPIYEFVCRSCGHPFEALVPNASSRVSCPSCRSGEIEKQLSTFAAHTGPGNAADCRTSSCGYDAGVCGSGMCGGR